MRRWVSVDQYLDGSENQQQPQPSIPFQQQPQAPARCGMEAGKVSDSSKEVLDKEITEEEDDDEYVIVAPDGGYGWIVTVASFLCILISDGILFSFGLILSELERVFNEPVAKVAWIFSIVNGISLMSGLAS